MRQSNNYPTQLIPLEVNNNRFRCLFKKYLYSKILVLLCLVVFFSFAAKAQDCPVPTSVTLSSTPAVCLGQGTVTVATINGVSAPNDSSVRYQLVLSSAPTSVVKPWQQSPVFASVPAGTYVVQIETVCGNTLSAIYTSAAVSVTGVTSAPTITGYTILSKALSTCASGSFTVTASTGGSTPYTYALLNTQNDPTQPPSGGYLVAPQLSDTFTNLAAGTYYVRVYDACGNWSNTSPIIVPAASSPSITLAKTYYGCDSLIPSVAITNNNYVSSSTPASTDRLWVTYNGVTDTVPNNQWNYTGNSYARLSTIISPTYPVTLSIGYSTITACGKIEIDSIITIDAPVIQGAFATQTTGTGCSDSVAVLFYLPNGGVSEYSLDTGSTWTSINFSSPGAQVFIYKQGGDSVSVMVRNNCGTYTFKYKASLAAVIPPPQPYLAEDNRVACNGNSGFVVGINFPSSTSGYGPTSTTTVTVLSQPAGANLPASWTYTPDPQSQQYYGSFSGRFGDTHLTSNLPLGTYQIRVSGATGQCNLTTDTTMTIVLTKPASYRISSISSITSAACNQPSQGGFEITIDTTNYAGGSLYNGGYFQGLITRAIVTNEQTGVVDSVTASVVATYNQTYSSRSIVIDGANMTNHTDIVPGTYRIQLVNFIGSDMCGTVPCYGVVSGFSTPASCVLDTTITVTWGNSVPLTVASSIAFSGCSDGTAVFALQAAGGNSTNYTYSLSLISNGDTTLVQGPQTSGIFNGLNKDNLYMAQISDGCTGLTYAVSFTNQPIGMHFNTATKPCPTDTFSMSIPSIPLGVYTWTVDWYNNAQANTEVLNAGTNPANTYTIVVPSAAGDSSRYTASVNLGSCLAQSNPYMMRPADCGLPLPIMLSNFSVQAAKTTAVVTWTTETEINNKGFYVQRSSNGANFTDLAFVASKANNGNSSGELNYSYTDKTPSPGINYYRLRQVDFNGTVSYSGVQSVTFNSTGTKAYPNPANSVLNVQLPANAVNASYELINSAGQVAAQGSLQSGNNAIAIGNLANGIYILRLAANGVTNSYKVSIVH